MNPRDSQSFSKEASATKRGLISRSAPDPAISPAKRWLFRAVALLGLPLLVLAGTEAGLRLGGYGYDTAFFRRAEIQGKGYWVQNDQFGLRFFPPRLARFPGPIRMAVEKPPGVQRIFILGESAAMGDPAPRFGASRYLEALLRERYPGTRFEVVNTALTAINSHAILPIARDCAKREGDLWIVYMGNNEMIGPYGAATVFGPKAPSLWFVRLTLALQRTRTGQALTALARRVREPQTTPQAEWGGMKMFLENTLPPGDPRREVVYGSFRRNLDDLLRAATASGARVLLSTVAVNLRDCSPFASTASSLTAQELEALRGPLTTDLTPEGLTSLETRLRTAVESAPACAELRFLLGLCLAQQGRGEPAREQFLRALEYDALPFRADPRINAAIREAGSRFADRGVVLCDAVGKLAHDSPAGIPGEDAFYEHVHFNFDGNYRLARAWAEHLEPLLPDSVRAGATAAWASQARCEERLGLTDWNRKWVLEEVIRRYEQPPLNAQATKPAQVKHLQAGLAALKGRLPTLDQNAARKLYQEAIQNGPADFRLHENYADFLEAIGDYTAALDQRRIVCELLPHYYFAHFSLGTLLKEQRQFEAAQASLERAASIHPTQPDIRLHLGSVYALQKQWDKALGEFAKGRELNPTEPRFWHMTGDVFWRMDRRKEAIDALRAAVEIAPDYVEARYRLAEALGLSGAYAEATTELERVLTLRPDHLRARINLGVALLRQGRAQEAVRQFDLALAIDPDNPTLQRFRAEAVAQSQRAR